MSLIESQPSKPAAEPAGQTAKSRPTGWLLALAVLPLAAVYFAMLNPYWVPSGDGEVYTAIARSVVRGEGLMFNGSPAAISPPGWPVVLAGVMFISPTFAALKIFTTLCMLGSLAITFFILRRFIDDRTSAVVVLLTGTLSTLYPLTYWMHAEAFFCLLASAAILLAFRVSENRGGVGSVAALLVLLAAMCVTRWPGVLHVALLVPILLRGVPRSWTLRRVITALLVVLVGAGSFLSTHRFLSLTPEQKSAARAAGGASEEEVDAGQRSPTAAKPPPGPPLPETDDSSTPSIPVPVASAERSAMQEYVHRALDAGTWFSYLLWQPSRFAATIRAADVFMLLVGWFVIGLLAVTAATAVLQRQWFWIGLAAYTGGLCLLWPNPNARYYVPIAPFILVGLFVALNVLARTSANAPRWPKVAAGLRVALIASLLLGNLPLLGYDIFVFRSGSKFYDRFEAGSNRSLIEACHYIRTLPDVTRVGVSEKYVNLNRVRYSKYGVRATHLLTDRIVIGAPRTNSMTRRPNRDVLRWAGENQIGVYLYQPPVIPWRVWHFRLPESIQARLVKEPIEPDGQGWELYQYNPDGMIRVSPPALDQPWPTRVPGL